MTPLYPRGSSEPIPDAVKAGWAVANARETWRRELGPLLRKAYRPGLPPDRDAMEEALPWAESIVATLKRGLEMLGGE